MKPVCVKCQRFYRPKRNGTPFIESKPIGGKLVPQGTSRPDLWEPYKLWMGDLWQCQGCGHQLISGVAGKPISQDYHHDFHQNIAAFDPKIVVNDC